MTDSAHRQDTREAVLFYDGGCGLCHRAVRFALRRTPSDTGLTFAPLGGATFTQVVPPDAARALPDSLVYVPGDGALLVRTDAVIALLVRIGGSWGLLARLLSVVPRRIRDAGYDAVARVRARLFARPAGVCPVVPEDVRGRFLP